MASHRLAAVLLGLLLTVSVPLAAGPSPQEPPAAPSWKPFQEFDFLLGSWTGTAESGRRLGGAVTQVTTEMNGNYVRLSGMKIFPAQEGRPEETVEEIGTFYYDRDKRRYEAQFVFSTGIVGVFEVETADGSLKLTSRELINHDSGSRSRILLKKTAEGLSYTIEIATAGKEFVPVYVTRQTRK